VNILITIFAQSQKLAKKIYVILETQKVSHSLQK